MHTNSHPFTLHEIVTRAVTKELKGIDPHCLNPKTGFFDLGLDSVTALSVISHLEDDLGISLPETLLFSNPNIESLTAFLSNLQQKSSPAHPAHHPSPNQPTSEPIAVIGMGLLMPTGTDVDCSTPADFLEFLLAGGDAIRPISKKRYARDVPTPGYGGFLSSVQGFDASFFAISPREAKAMDPQQRKVLETAWHTLEDAGINAEALRGTETGVFIGTNGSDYASVPFVSGQLDLFDAYYGIGRSIAAAAGRVAYVLGLEGPALCVDTACSSSLVAVHTACQSLRAGDCTMAFVGGIQLHLLPEVDLALHKAGMFAPDGRCKTFDTEANGYVRGEGCGLLLLQPLSQALEQGRRIRAVLQGTYNRQDGVRVGLTVPDGRAQSVLVHRAVERSGLNPNDIDYVELHGTGTPLGDPIEFNALTSVFTSSLPRDTPLYLGATKTNIGHLEAAAGIAGLIKTILCMERGILPGNPHLKTVSPKIDLESIPAHMPTQVTPWPQRSNQPRRAVVSSFGFTGALASVVVEASPDTSTSAYSDDLDERPAWILAFSAASEPSLHTLTEQYRSLLMDPNVPLTPLVNAAHRYKTHLPMRRAVVGANRTDLKKALSAVQLTSTIHPHPRVAFIFSGQTSHYVGMTKALYHSDPYFRGAFDDAARALTPHLGFSIYDAIHTDDESRLQRTDVCQPALFTVGYALARMWMAYGIQPDFIAGHSAGEIQAAVIAGALSLEQAAQFIVARGQLMASTPTNGAAVAVRMSPEDADTLIAPYSDQVAVAVVNGLEDVVISGERTALMQCLAPAKEAGIATRILPVSLAFHSPFMDPILESLTREAAHLQTKTPSIPFYTPLFGRFVCKEDLNGSYWAHHARQPVMFTRTIDAAIEHGCTFFLEIGPKADLTPLIKRYIRTQRLGPVPEVAASLHQGRCDVTSTLETVACLYQHGITPDWAVLTPGPALPPDRLPLYPFEAHPYWIDDSQSSQETAGEPLTKQAANPVQLTLVPFHTATHSELIASLSERIAHLDVSGNNSDVSPLANIVCAVFGHVLRCSPAQILPERDLFSLGLDSILAMEALQIINRLFGISCSLRLLFESRTPHAFAYQIQALVTTEETSQTNTTLVPNIDHRHHPFPLTELQHAYWIGRGPAFTLGNVACHVYFETETHAVTPDVLERAWNTLIKRHEALRLVIDDDGQQRILNEVPWYTLYTHDASTTSTHDTEHHVESWRQELSHQILPTNTWPLFDLRITLLPGRTLRIHFSIDMLIHDAMSAQILWTELEALCQGDGTLKTTPLQPLCLSFRDYVIARTQPNTPFAAERERARLWWQAHLDDLPPAPALPLTCDPVTLKNPHFVRHTRIIPTTTWTAIKKQAMASGVTPASVLLSVFAAVLSAWSTSSRFTINLTVFDRRTWHDDLPHLVGDFTSVVLLPVTWDVRASFEENTQALFHMLMTCLEHRAFSAVDVLRELGRRQGGHPVMMPVVFTSQLGLTPPFQGTREDSILGPVEYAITQTPQVWIDQQVSEREDGALVMNWDVVEALFPDRLPSDLFQAAVSLLECLGTPLTSQDSCHWKDPVGSLMPDDQRRVRQQVNTTNAPVPTGLLHHPFFAHACTRPESIALIDADHTTWTYRALADWSARIANVISINIKGGAVTQPIAVLMEKGPEQVAAVLGILAAGQTYVPLDPFWPDARITTILEKSDISIIMTQPWRAVECSRRFGTSERHIIDVSEAALCHTSSDRPKTEAVDPQSPAYIIYTSGSTGVPKGVVMDHRGPLNTVTDINQRFGIEPDDRVFGLSALSFDLSVYDIFGTFAAGATLVLPREEDRRDPIQWSALCQRHGVTVWNSVPALLDMLLIEENFSAAAGLRLVMLSGDWVPLHLPERLRQYSPTTRLVCMGGATEASIWSNWFLVDRVDPQWRSIPYGFPLTNQGYRILDTCLHDRPDWVPGDLYISGIGLALGYAEDPEKTAESFIIHPTDGTRLYRTGDMARYWSDGTIEFLGRCDHQVKIAGHRIETGEIEAAFRAHPSVHEAVVDAVGTDGDIKKLIAWITADPEHLDADPCLFPEHHNPFSQDTDARLHAHLRSALEGHTTSAQTFAAYRDTLARLALQSIRDTFAESGLSFSSRPMTRHHVFSTLQAMPNMRAVVDAWLDLLITSGDLVADAGQTLSSPHGLQNETWNDLRHDTRHVGLPVNFATALQKTAGRRLAVIQGREEALSLFYGIDDTLSPERLASLDLLFEDALGAVGQSLEHLAQSMPKETPLRVLDIGVRSGRTTAALLRHVTTPLHYTAADTSTAFLDKARNVLKDLPNIDVTYTMFDLDRDPVTQGLQDASFDIILGFNALHRTRHVPRLLSWLRRLLVPGGKLLALEMTQETPLQAVTVNLLEAGYTSLEDERLSSRNPLLTPQQWKKVLAEEGWCLGQTFPSEDDEITTGMHILTAATPSPQRRLASDNVQAWLAQRVPAYMIPTATLWLEQMPLSVNGKVDRHQLPKPVVLGAQKTTTRQAETPEECLLSTIWDELLHTTNAGPDDHFFEVGGDSLIAVRMIEKLRGEHNLAITVRDIFDTPRLSDFATRLAEAPPCHDEALPPLIAEPDHRHAPFNLTDVQQAYWVGRHLIGDLGGVSTWFYVEMDVPDTTCEQLAEVWNSIIGQHEMLRTIVDENAQQRILDSVPVYKPQTVDLSLCPREERDHTIATWRDALSHSVLPTETWPLFAFRLARLDAKTVRIFFGIDNIICDGRSIQLLLHEWAQGLKAPSSDAGTPHVSGLSFRDYLTTLETLQTHERWRRSLTWWLHRFESLPPAPELPILVDPRAIHTPRFMRQDSFLPASTWQCLQKECADQGVTPNAVFLTLYGMVLGAFSRRSDVTINLTLFHRVPFHPEIDRLIGDFTSLILLAVSPHPTACFADAVRTVQKQLWDDIGHMDVSAVHLLRRYAQEHGLSQPPAFPVVFTSGVFSSTHSSEESDRLGPPPFETPGPFGFGITQTPQTWLDHQIMERNGTLFFNWDYVAGLFPSDLMETMFTLYDRLLHASAQSDMWSRSLTDLLPQKTNAAFSIPSPDKYENVALPSYMAEDTHVVEFEHTLTDLIQKVCGLSSPPDRVKNFFEMGLTSLDLIRIHQALRREVSTSCQVVDLFRSPSIATLAHTITKAAPSFGNSPEVPHTASSRRSARRRQSSSPVHSDQEFVS